MRLRSLYKPILNRFLPRLTRWYLRKPRRYRYDGLDLVIEPGVFHPGLFFSTKLMVDHLRGEELRGLRVLEIGVGSGMLSIWCARAGAEVTGTDISPVALACARKNVIRNGVVVPLFHSDLWAALPVEAFDWVVVNPPYYPGEPVDEADHAWRCGPEFDYFVRFFGGLRPFVGVNGRVRMVLSEDCALDRIAAIAGEAGWALREVEKAWRGGEWGFVFAVVKRG